MENYFLVLMITLFLGCQQKSPPSDAANVQPTTEQQPVTQPAPNKVETTILAGEWTRTDAPYQLKISDIGENGAMKAGYFNPKSIHVEKSTWMTNATGLSIYIELQDLNYPGSNYTLFYIPGKDKLAGKYFQAVEGMTYDVEFIRTK